MWFLLRRRKVPGRRLSGRGRMSGTVLQIILNALIRIQLWRVRWKKEESKALLNRFGFNKRGNLTCLMKRMPINNKEDFTIGTMNQSFHELDKTCCTHTTSHYHESEFAPGTHRRNHIQPETRSGAAHNRRLSLDGQRGTRMMIRSHSSLVSKEYQRFFTACKAANLREFLLQPVLDSFRLLLIRAPNRTLRRQAQLYQQPAYGRFAQFHTKSIGAYLSDHFGRPQGRGELKLQRVLHRHGAKYPLQGRAIELRRPSTSLTCIQRAPSPVTVPCQPAIQSRTGDTHCLGDNFRAMAFVHTGYSPLSDGRQSLMVQLPRVGFPHAKQYTVTA